ncbi:MAG: polyprenyl synthetase family protein [Shewanellaceae bacterium]|nr:polyprenyl synthetase family protein [Shewanellaceae bacterium]
MNLSAISTLLAAPMQKVNDLIHTALRSNVALIQQLGWYITQNGGKRIRPMLSLLMAQAHGYQGDQHIRLGAIVELIHTSTLLHDDVVDTANMRRGQPTANIEFGNSASVLVGDFMYSRAFQLITELNDLTMIKILADTTNILAEGEVLQLTHTHNASTTEAAYRHTIYCKTASLFEAIAQLGGLLNQCSADQQQACQTYGRHLGMAFQIVDDVLDYTAATETLGKNIGADLAEGKMTMPLIYAMQAASPSEKRVLTDMIESGQCHEVETVQRLLIKSGALAYTQAQAEQEINLATAALHDLPESVAKEALIGLAYSCLARQH